MMAQHRSQSLYDCVVEGEISMEAILALPIDWQGLAVERQWEKRHLLEVEEVKTKSLLEVKRAPRAKRRRRIIPPSKDTSLQQSSLDSALGLNLYGTPSTPELHISSSFTPIQEAVAFSCPSTPDLDHSGSSTPTDTEFYVSTPTFMQHDDDIYTNPFTLQSYCSAFNDAEIAEEVF